MQNGLNHILSPPKGYLIPTADYIPDFPKDHGSHPDYGIEWWYWVGHLESEDGERNFGFQSTVFRVAGDPDKAKSRIQNSFGNQNLFLVHSALSDLTNGTYSHLERVYREGWQARASTEELKLRVGGVEANLLQKEDGQRVITNYKNGDRLELSFRPLKPMVVFGNRD